MIFLFGVGVIFFISILWVMSISNMDKNYPNYKGEDFLDESGRE